MSGDSSAARAAIASATSAAVLAADGFVRSTAGSYAAQVGHEPCEPSAVAGRYGHRRAMVRVEQGTGKLGAGRHADLAEHLLQVILDGAGADEQLRRHLPVGRALRDQSGYLQLLRRELIVDVAGSPGDPFAGGQQFPAVALREPGTD